MKAVLVTGANGFIGRHMCAGLRARGMRVRAMVRRTTSDLDCDEQAMVSSLLDREDVRRAVEGVDTVVHLAARVHVMDESPWDSLDQFLKLNVEATRLMLEEATVAGARRFLLASSVKVMGEVAEIAWTECTAPAPVDAYGWSKLEAEQVVRDWAQEHPLRASILRLPLVYGAGMKGNMLRLFRWVDAGLPLPLRAVRNRRSLVFVGNVIAAARAVLEHPAGNATFFVSDDAAVSTPDLLRAIAESLGTPPRLWYVPVRLLQLAGRMGDLLAARVPVAVTSTVVDRLVGSLVIDSSRLTAVTGFRPPYSLSQGLQQTARWFRETYPSRRMPAPDRT